VKGTDLQPAHCGPLHLRQSLRPSGMPWAPLDMNV